jgi:N-methylhydantoinase A/oxoprolinase/acetone carboxylase beta subunit
MRFDGTDTALLITGTGDDAEFEEEFMKAYQNEFGFTLETKVMVDDVKVGAGAHHLREVTRESEDASPFPGQGRWQDF